MTCFLDTAKIDNAQIISVKMNLKSNFYKLDSMR